MGNKVKNKKRKLLAFVLSPLVALCTMSLSFTSSCGYKLPFYNFENYMGPVGVDALSKDFLYNEFGDVDEYEQLIRDNKAVGGITNVFVIAKMIQENYVQKLDFNKIFGASFDTSSPQKIEQQLEALYTPATWKYMLLYDKVLFHGEDHLYNYMIPYFLQGKVIAYNIHRGGNPGHDLFSSSEQGTLTWQAILQRLRENGYKNLGVNNYFRDNVMIGSTVKYDNNGQISATEEEPMQGTGDPQQSGGPDTKNDYERYVNNFVNLINRNFPGDDHQYSTDGANLLLQLIDPHQNLDSAMIYNGDALDAYYANNNYSQLKNGEDIRYIMPKQSVFQLDGLMITKQSYTKISNQSLNDLYSDINEGLYRGGFDFDEYNQTDPKATNYIQNSSLFQNFEYVKYTMTFEKMQDYIMNLFNSGQFSGDPTVDKYGGQISQLLASWISSNNVPYPIDDQLKTEIESYYSNEIVS